MIWLLALAQSTAPTATNMAGLFRAEDTPVAIMPGNVLKSVNTAVTVTPQGKIQDCKVEVSSGIQKLDAHTCALLIRRAKFRPAIDRDGTSIYGVYRTQIDWWVGDGYPPRGRTIPELSLTVNALPPKTKSPALLRLMFRVDASGHVSDCSLQDKKGDPALVKLGCEELIKSYTATPARNLAGALVASVQMATVQFEVRP
jgi:hypothetical protein